EMSGLDAELVADSIHFYTELGKHGGAKFDWRKIDGEMREWMPGRYPQRYIEVRTGNNFCWRGETVARDGLGNSGLRVARVRNLLRGPSLQIAGGGFATSKTPTSRCDFMPRRRTASPSSLRP